MAGDVREIDIDRLSASVMGESLNAGFLVCPVCTENFSVEGELVPMKLNAELASGGYRAPCEHSLCGQCAAAVFSREHRRCPMCQAPLASYSKNLLAIQLMLAAKLLQKRSATPGHHQDESLRLRTRVAEVEHLLGQATAQLTQARQDQGRLRQLRDEALRTSEYYQQRELAATRQLGVLAQESTLAKQDLLETRRQLELYRRDRAQTDDNRRLVAVLSAEVQKQQDQLDGAYRQLSSRESEAQRWQRMYGSALGDVEEKEGEVEELKRTVRSLQQSIAPPTPPAELLPTGGGGVNGGGGGGGPSSWFSRAASWMKGPVLSTVPGLLCQQLDRYLLQEKLGASLSSCVYLAEDEVAKCQVAIKRIAYTLGGEASGLLAAMATVLSSSPPSSSSSASSSSTSPGASFLPSMPLLVPPPSHAVTEKRRITDLCREAMLLRLLNHDNIVRLLGFVHLPDPHSEGMLVMDYVPFDLQFQIANRHIAAESQVRVLLHQVLSALHYLHSSQVVHRAIGPTTILVEANGRIRLAAFRDARSLLSAPLDAVHAPTDVQYSYWSPELIAFNSEPTKQRLSSAVWKAVDMWAVGAVLVEAILGSTLFDGTSPQSVCESLVDIKELRPHLLGGETESFPLLQRAFAQRPVPTSSLIERLRSSYFLTRADSRGLSKECLELMSSLLKFDPTQRFTVAEALGHSFFASLGRSELPHHKAITNLLTDSEIPEFARTNLGLRLS